MTTSSAPSNCLHHLSLIEASGDDAGAFLQSQLSNDIEQIAAGQLQLSAYCNPKGRMLALLRIAKLADNHYALVLPSDLIESVTKRLQMFVLRAKVSLKIHHHGVLAWFDDGSQAETSTQRFTYETPNAPPCQHGIIIDLDSPADDQSHHDATATNDGDITPSQRWQAAELRAGLPQVYAATHEKLIPQMVNLDRCGGLNFKKGCYPGQEIVARLRYLGKLKQRMQLLSTNTDFPINVGDDIVAMDTPDKRVGEVVDVVNTAEGKLLLATIPTARLLDGEFALATAPNTQLQRLDLPYPLPEASSDTEQDA